MHSAAAGAAGLPGLNGGAALRVAMVAACPFPSLRGSQVLIRELAEQLAMRGHSVSVVTYPNAQHMVPVRGIAIHRVAKIPGLWTKRSIGWQKLFLDVLLAIRLLRVVREERAQVIHAHNIEGALVAILVGRYTSVPVVYHAHSALSDELPRYSGNRFLRTLLRHLGAFLDGTVAAAADFSVALTDRLGAYLAVRGAAGRISVIPPGASRLRRVVAHGGGSGTLRIMYAGNLDPYQDLDVLIRGFSHVREAVPRAELIVVTHEAAGRSARCRLASLNERRGVKVTCVPSFAATRRLLSGADVLVSTRASWSGFPIKLLNYMALGLPIVHAQSSAHAINDGLTGLVFPDNDAEALGRAILRLAADPPLGAQLGRAARGAAQDEFDWKVLIPRVEAVYAAAGVGGLVAGMSGAPRTIKVEESVDEWC